MAVLPLKLRVSRFLLILKDITGYQKGKEHASFS